MTRHLGRTLALAFGLALLSIVVGCGEDKPTKPKVQARDTIGKTTQDVRELKAELAKGGVLTDGKTHATEALDLYADVYRTKVAEIEEFMEVIIKKGKADGIQLAVLPYYQEYAYDADNKELVVVEYPAKKKAMQDQTDREMHRK
jgi:hypothetical protein